MDEDTAPEEPRAGTGPGGASGQRHLGVMMSTDDFPARDRFAAWVDLVSNAFVPVQVTTDDPAAYQGRLLGGVFGQVGVGWVCSSSCTSRRTPRLISASDPYALQLMLVVRGTAGVSQNGAESTLGPGDLAFHTTWRPFTLHAKGDDTGLAIGATAVVPRDHVLLPTNTLESLSARDIPGDAGSGGLLAGLLAGLTRQPPTPPAGAARLACALADLLTVSLNEAADRRQAVPPDIEYRALFVRARAFVQRQLGDPGLTPATVAAAHHVSTRTLNRVFEEHGDTVADLIRRGRLDRCLRDLADPALRHRPVHDITARWGFRSATHFNSRCKAATGMTPSQYRRVHLHGA
ncbi:helix-turn-helix domain-containing protein [Amycolatopsis sp.]|uniref:helix-turn-helix domain-containing protein n=1 Tax=Amycolatopsis sp. TaxID=37632 RepID=UPI002D7F7E13|nr:helix-turn-helix domain-containing protein [Amycolatopsis sp.]HET6704271.1 helix-turn-helix domain-containing protein [Amycolatopsis sp.]